jgi:hypothetical protein
MHTRSRPTNALDVFFRTSDETNELSMSNEGVIKLLFLTSIKMCLCKSRSAMTRVAAADIRNLTPDISPPNLTPAIRHYRGKRKSMFSKKSPRKKVALTILLYHLLLGHLGHLL